jgi:alkylation response protein AidB-like acyl-CoA dehydrogenase
MRSFQFDAPSLPPEAAGARRRVREFLASERDARRYVPHRSSWSTFDAEFTRRAGAAGFIGITWPKEYGGQALSSLVRYVITQEMLAAGASCATAASARRS